MNLTETKTYFLETLSGTRTLNVHPVEGYDGFSWFDDAMVIRFHTLPMSGSGNQIPSLVNAPYGTIKKIEIKIKNELKEVLKQNGIARPRRYLSTRTDYIPGKDIRLIAKYVDIIGTHLATQDEVRALQEVRASASLEKRILRKAQAEQRHLVLNQFLKELANNGPIEIMAQTDEVLQFMLHNGLIVRTEIGPESVMITDISSSRECQPEAAASLLNTLSCIRGLQ
jgi:hypothetical protein